MSEEKRPRGFQTLSDARRREIAASGGRAAHREGRAHEWTAKEARRAGMKGGRKAAEARQAREQQS